METALVNSTQAFKSKKVQNEFVALLEIAMAYHKP